MTLRRERGTTAAAAEGILAFAAAANAADKDRKFGSPAIAATLNDAATSLNASFAADSLASDEQLRIWVTSGPDRRTLYRASFGPDSSGAVKQTVQLPLGFGSTTQRLVLRAWKSGADPARREMGAGPNAANKTPMILPSRETIFARARATRKGWEACPQRHAASVAWARLAVPEPAK